MCVSERERAGDRTEYAQSPKYVNCPCEGRSVIKGVEASHPYKPGLIVLEINLQLILLIPLGPTTFLSSSSPTFFSLSAVTSGRVSPSFPAPLLRTPQLELSRRLGLEPDVGGDG